jgi:hypothetical protein
MKELNSVLNPAHKELFNAAIAINSTAFEDLIMPPASSSFSAAR